MPKEIYNEGRVVGLSSYELYVRQVLSSDPKATPMTEREWLASTLSDNSSMILKVPAGLKAGYHDFELPRHSTLAACTVVYASIFQGQATFESGNPSAWAENHYEGLDYVTLYTEYIWTDGDNMYYSHGSVQYVLDRHENVWIEQSWTGLSDFTGNHIWSFDDNIYYSNGSDQYVLSKLSKNTWIPKLWERLSDFYGEDIWIYYNDTYHTYTVYYSHGPVQYVLDSSDYTWSEMTWVGLTDFNGRNVWTDGLSTYYSYCSSDDPDNNQQFTLARSGSTLIWQAESWGTQIFVDPSAFWSDGSNTYYSNASLQYVLNPISGKWHEKEWSGLTYFNGKDVWTDGDDIYFSYDNPLPSNSDQYVLDRSNSNWTPAPWRDSYPKISGSNVWKDGETIYYSRGYGLTPGGVIQGDMYVFDKSEKTWNPVTWYIDSTLSLLRGEDVWTHGDDIYYSSNYKHFYFDRSHSTWRTWTCNINSVEGRKVWSDGSYTYFSDGSSQYVFNGTSKQWEPKVWEGLTNFYGYSVGTDGTNIYVTAASGGNYVLVSGSKWIPKTWLTDRFNLLTASKGIWKHDSDIYYSEGLDQYIFDKTNRLWDIKVWNGLTSFNGNCIWSDELNNVYFSDGATHYSLDTSTDTWSSIHWYKPAEVDVTGVNIWTDGSNSYYSEGSMQYVFDKIHKTWFSKVWYGLTEFDGANVWKDIEGNVYYSDGSSVTYVLDLSTNTWEPKSWINFSEILGSKVWSDGFNVYYSNGSDQYVFDRPLSTWNIKRWTGLTTFDGDMIWQANDKVYYSHEQQHYVLDRSNSTWTSKEWTDLTEFYGDRVWSDGVDTYYSDGPSAQFILDISTSTWTAKTWAGLTNIHGYNIWTDGIDTFYSDYALQYVLIDSTGVWATKVEDYGYLINNKVGEGNHPVTPGEPKDVPVAFDPENPPKNFDGDFLDMCDNFLKIQSGLVLQPGEWVECSTDPGKANEDLIPDITRRAFVRILLTEPTDHDVLVLLHGFMDSVLLAGNFSYPVHGLTNRPENGDFLGPTVYPWSCPIFFIITSDVEKRIIDTQEHTSEELWEAIQLEEAARTESDNALQYQINALDSRATVLESHVTDLGGVVTVPYDSRIVCDGYEGSTFGDGDLLYDDDQSILGDQLPTPLIQLWDGTT